MNQLNSCEIEFSVISDEDSFLSLKTEWDTLFANASDAYLSEAFEWCKAGWLRIAKPAGKVLHVVIGKNDRGLCVVMPFVCHSYRGLKKLNLLGSETTEYDNILVANSEHRKDIIDAGIRYLFTNNSFDIIELPNIRQDGLLYETLEKLKVTTADWVCPSSWVDLTSYDKWENYYKTIGAGYRSTLARKERRLREYSNVKFQIETDPTQKEQLLNWIITNKTKWMESKGLNPDWINADRFRQFLSDTLHINISGCDRRIFALIDQGKIVAAEFSSVDRRRVEWFMSSYSEEYAKYSPGQLLKMYCLKWAFENNLSYDLRKGDEPEKAHWKNMDCYLHHMILSNSLSGRVYVSVIKFQNLILYFKNFVVKKISNRHKDNIKSVATKLGLKRLM